MNIHTLEQNLKCPICWNIPDDPQESSCCGHIFCLPCTNQIDERKCPICRNTYMTFRKNFLARKLLEEISIICHFGCEELIKINKMKEHRYDCKKAVFKCTIENCNYSLTKDQMSNHIVSEHLVPVMLITEQYENLKSLFDKHDVKKPLNKKSNIPQLDLNQLNFKMNYNYNYSVEDMMIDSASHSDYFDEIY